MSIPTVGPHRVRKPFDADGRRVIPGEIIDVTEYRNAYQLVDRGYLVALSAAELEQVQVDATAKKAPVKKAAAKKVAAKKQTVKE